MRYCGMNLENYSVESIPLFYDEYHAIATLQYCEKCNDMIIVPNILKTDLVSSLSVDTVINLMKNKEVFNIIDAEHQDLCWKPDIDDTLKTQILIDLFIKEIEDLLRDVRIRSYGLITKKLEILYKYLKNIQPTSPQVQINLIAIVDQFLKTMDAYNHLILEKHQNSRYSRVLSTNHVFIPYFFREKYARDAYYAKFFNGLRNVYVNCDTTLKGFITHCGFEIEEMGKAFKCPGSDDTEGVYSVWLCEDSTDTTLVCVDKSCSNGEYKYVCFPLKSLRIETTICVSFDFRDVIDSPTDSFEFKEYINLYFSSFMKLLDRYCK